MLLASFNSGPRDQETWIALAVMSVLILIVGVLLRSAVRGALVGGLIGFGGVFLLMAMYGGFLGAEIVLAVFAAGGTVLGLLIGGVSQFIAYRTAKSKPLSPPPPAN